MPQRSIRQLKAGKEQADKRLHLWDAIWRDAYRLVLPQRNLIDPRSPGANKSSLVFDSTGMNSFKTASNRIQADLFPANSDIIKLEPGPAVPDDALDEAREQLEDTQNKFHAALHHSNFSVVLNEFLLELLIGTGLMLLNEGPDHDPFVFTSVPTPTVALEEGAAGKIGAFYRTHKMPISVATATWPEMIMPQDWVTKAVENPDEEVSFAEATYHVPDDDMWYYHLFLEAEEIDLLPAPRVYPGIGPWIGTRWSRAANELYGRGPVIDALPDIRTANRLVELILMNASIAVSGVYTGVNDGVLNPNTASLTPGTIIPVARNAGHPQGASLLPLERAGDFDVSQIILENLQSNIRHALFDKGLPPPQGTPPSATETIQRIREFTLDTGPAFARLMRELVVPVVLRGLQILNSKGIINFPFKIDGTTIKITMTSPLAKQQALQDVQTVMEAAELASFFGPEVVALNLKIEDVPNFIFDKMGVPSSLQRSPAEKKKLKDDAVAALKQQADAQQQGQPPAAPPPAGAEQPPVGEPASGQPQLVTG